jgi:hypothetical protein
MSTTLAPHGLSEDSIISACNMSSDKVWIIFRAFHALGFGRWHTGVVPSIYWVFCYGTVTDIRIWFYKVWRWDCCGHKSELILVSRLVRNRSFPTGPESGLNRSVERVRKITSYYVILISLESAQRGMSAFPTNSDLVDSNFFDGVNRETVELKLNFRRRKNRYDRKCRNHTTLQQTSLVWRTGGSEKLNTEDGRSPKIPCARSPVLSTGRCPNCPKKSFPIKNSIPSMGRTTAFPETTLLR